MTSDPDIYRAAKLVIDQHGEDAPLRAATVGALAPTWHIHSMAEATYRILIRKNEHTCDVEIAGPGTKPPVMRTFNSEARAWEWITEQELVSKFAVAEAKARQGKPAVSLDSDELRRLGEAAVAELERRGYNVRGKSADQITKILRFPPPKPKASP